MKNKFFKLGVASIALFIFSGCKKGDSTDTPVTGTTKRHAKIVFTISNTFSKTEGDYFDVTVSGANGNSTIAWIVNGTKKTGVNVSAGTDDFNGGKTITLESDGNYDWGKVSFGGFEYGATPFNVTWKIEVDNVVKDSGNEKIIKGREPVFSKTVQL